MVDSGAIQRDFGKRLKELRKERDLSQEKLGFKAGIDRTFVNSIENGRRNVTLVTIFRLAFALGIEPRELMP